MTELFVTFFKLGIFTIGGGVAMIPILSDIMVKDKKWFSEKEMLDIISVCQSMPGVIAVNMATYVGFKRRGFFGSLVATAGVIIPSFVIILLIAGGLSSVGDNPYVAGVLGGLRAAALGLILVAVLQVAKGVVKGVFSAAAAAAAFVAITCFKISVVYVILLYIAVGIIAAFALPKRSAGTGIGSSGSVEASDELTACCCGVNDDGGGGFADSDSAGARAGESTDGGSSCTSADECAGSDTAGTAADDESGGDGK